MILQNAPLVELIVELRWSESPFIPEGSSQVGAGDIPLIVGVSALESFYAKFGEGAAHKGYLSSERLTPPQTSIKGHPTCRFKKDGDSKSHTLYQIGPDLLTINAVPPYLGWDSFSGVVAEGIELLLNTVAESGKPFEFSSISIRYINAFTNAHTGGMDAVDFIENVLGFKCSLPDSVLSRKVQSAKHRPFLQFQVPMGDQVVLNLGVGEGVSNGQEAIVMDISLSKNAPVAADARAAMEFLASSRNTIHDIFFEATKSIEDRLHPRGAK